MRLTSVILILSYVFVFVLGDYSIALAQDMESMIDDAVDQIVEDVSRLGDARTDFRTVAIWNIETEESKEEVNVDRFIDKLLFSLIEAEKLIVIDREKLKELMEEVKLSYTGVIDEAYMQQVGKQIGVDGFLYGNIEALKVSEQPRLLLARIKLIKTETGEFLYGKEITGIDRKYAVNRIKEEPKVQVGEQRMDPSLVTLYGLGGFGVFLLLVLVIVAIGISTSGPLDISTS